MRKWKAGFAFTRKINNILRLNELLQKNLSMNGGSAITPLSKNHLLNKETSTM
jgi:hypothetical protein